MKKLLSILMLLVAIVTGAKGATESISWAITTNSLTITPTITPSTDAKLSNASTSITLQDFSSTSSQKDGYCKPFYKTAVAFDESKNYAQISFVVAEGYTFTPTSFGMTVFSYGTGELKYKVIISDSKSTVTSNEIQPSSGGEAAITFADGAFTGKTFEGTVTIKLYAYNYSNSGSGKKTYIKSPITISGTVASAAPATPYTVTFNAGAHGTYTGGDIQEESAGAGITLPALTTLEDGYIFNGWYTAATGGEKAGDAGKNYKPTANNTPLYAQYSEIPTPTFELSETSIEVGQTAQIKVIGKDDLDGVTLTDLTYDDTKISINETGVVTAQAAGADCSITFNSSAVAGKYNASSGNLSITVTAPKCATPTISPVSFSTDNQEVTITSETAGATIYYTTDGATPSTNSLVYDSENKPTISSTTTFKAIAVKENYDDSEVATQKITRTSSAVVASWDFTNWSSETIAGTGDDTDTWAKNEKSDGTGVDFSGGKGAVNKTAISTAAVIKYGTTEIEETKNLKFGATNTYRFALVYDLPSATVSKKENVYQGGEYIWLFNSNATITIPSVPAGATIEIGVETHNHDNARGVTLKNGSTTLTQTQGEEESTEYQECKWTNISTAGNVVITPSAGLHIYYIKVTSNVETVPVSTIGSNNYATYVTENDLDFTDVEGITAYIATADNGPTITTEAVTEVPTGTALLIKTANPGSTVNVPVAASTPATLTANKLKYSASPLVITSEQAAAKQYYGFFKVGEKYGFAPMKAGTLAAKKAYLEYESNTLHFIALDLEDAPTAIDFVEAENNANSAAPVKVIKNGKLFIGNFNIAGQQVK